MLARLQLEFLMRIFRRVPELLDRPTDVYYPSSLLATLARLSGASLRGADYQTRSVGISVGLCCPGGGRGFGEFEFCAGWDSGELGDLGICGGQLRP